MTSKKVWIMNEGKKKERAISTSGEVAVQTLNDLLRFSGKNVRILETHESLTAFTDGRKKEREKQSSSEDVDDEAHQRTSSIFSPQRFM